MCVCRHMCILVLFSALLICPVFFIYFPQCSLNTYFLAQKSVSESLSTFPSLDLESAIFQGILDPAWKMVFRDQKQGAWCTYYCLDVITSSFFQQNPLIHTDSSINSDLVIQCYKLCLPLLHVCIFCLPIV